MWVWFWWVPVIEGPTLDSGKSATLYFTVANDTYFVSFFDTWPKCSLDDVANTDGNVIIGNVSSPADIIGTVGPNETHTVPCRGIVYANMTALSGRIEVHYRMGILPGVTIPRVKTRPFECTRQSDGSMVCRPGLLRRPAK